MDDTRPLLSLPTRLARGEATVFFIGSLVCLWSLLLLSCGKRGDPLPPLRLFPAAPEQVKISQRGPFIALEWTAPVRNRDGSEDIQLEAAEVLRRVMEIPPPPPPPPPPTPVAESSQETIEDPSLTESAEVEAEGEKPPEEETTSPDQPESEEPEATPSKPQLTESVDPSEQAGEESAESETTSPTSPSTLVPDEPTPPPPPPFAEEATVIATVESVQGGEALAFRDPWDPEWEGMRVQYAVRYINKKGRRGIQSPVKNIDPLPPIDPPVGVTTEIEEGLVRLRWSPIEPSDENDLSFHFNVYRKSGEEIYPRDPLNGEPIDGVLYEDRTTSFDQEYCYVVRSVAIHPEPEPEPEIETSPELAEEATEATEEEQTTETTETVPDEQEPETQGEPAPGETAETASGEVVEPTSGETLQAAPQPPPVAAQKALVESVDSEEVCLTPKDTYPPPAPGNLFAVEVSDGILLSWDDVPSTDLGGYLVYRSEDDDGPFELVTEQPVPLASYTDRTAEPGILYYYRVSAVDRAEPRNESPHSRVASARAEQRP
jgi:hypothetical protein